MQHTLYTVRLWPYEVVGIVEAASKFTSTHQRDTNTAHICSVV
jgi:hypothetical protein